MSTKPKIMQNACRETLKNSGKMQKRSQKGPKTDANRTQNKQNTTSNDRKDAKQLQKHKKLQHITYYTKMCNNDQNSPNKHKML